MQRFVRFLVIVAFIAAGCLLLGRPARADQSRIYIPYELDVQSQLDTFFMPSPDFGTSVTECRAGITIKVGNWESPQAGCVVVLLNDPNRQHMDWFEFSYAANELFPDIEQSAAGMHGSILDQVVAKTSTFDFNQPPSPDRSAICDVEIIQPIEGRDPIVIDCLSIGQVKQLIAAEQPGGDAKG